MPTPHSFVRPALTLLFLTGSLAAVAADAPRPWEQDAFLPVTEARIAALPAGEQPAWRAYWQQSLERAKGLGTRDLVDHTPNKPIPVGTFSGGSYSKGVKLNAPAAWYASEEARSLADKVVNWQRPSGGWVKGGDYTRDPLPADDHHDAWSNGTFDNDATLYEMRFLALVAQSGGEEARVAQWHASFLRGLDYIFAAQYPNGGFPQIYPLVGWYHDAITYNDEAMVHILELCRDIAEHKPEFVFVSPALKARAGECLDRGIRCVLATQLRDAAGHLTIWGQQHDPLTLQPCAARNFEPIAECSNESVGLVKFLMTIPSPTPEIIASVEAAIGWFPAHALHGVAWDRRRPEPGLQASPDAPDLWSRYYELGTGKPIFSERDRMVHYDVSEISLERRKGYGWFNTLANDLPAAHAQWKAQLTTQ
jgi:PelA/Pel-15E family pectate lyase